MKLLNYANVSTTELAQVEAEVSGQRTLEDVLTQGFPQARSTRRPAVVTDVVVQDEFTHDVVVPWLGNLVLVYGTTCLGGITGVSLWDHQPTADELLAKRVANGWQPTPSGLKEGDRVLGHAACLTQPTGSV
ncbi:MAG TPA: hypothetical protein VI756_17525 [Blastocatellia bacterium]